MSGAETEGGEPNLAAAQHCLDFVNTVNDRLSDHAVDSLTSYAELAAWGQRAGIVNEAEASHLLAEAAAHVHEAASALQSAIAFREALYHTLLATLAGKLPEDDDLAILNATRAQALAHSEIVAKDEGFAWRWNISESNLGWMLWPIVRAAADLLLSPGLLKKVKECSSDDCGWLFLDTSKNHTRRWCTMEGCGNRAKSRRHYQRKRQGAQEQASLSLATTRKDDR